MYDPIETIAAEVLKGLQLERLRWTIAQAARSPCYGKVFAERGLTPESVGGLDDLRRFPLTSKQDLRDSYPFGCLATPKEEVVRMHHALRFAVAGAEPYTEGARKRLEEAWGIPFFNVDTPPPAERRSSSSRWPMCRARRRCWRGRDFTSSTPRRSRADRPAR